MRWWRFVVNMELRKILAYRSDFWVTFLGQAVIQLVIARALWQNIFAAQNVEVMNGFTIETITLYALIIPLGTKILIGENVGFLSREIYDGTFTRYLIYPLSLFQYKTMTYLTYSLFYAVQLILIYLLFKLSFATSSTSSAELFNLFMGVVLFCLAGLTYLMMSMLIELLALFADHIWSLMVMLRFFTSFFGGGMIPLIFYPEWALKFLYFTPFPFMVSLPAKTILGLNTMQEIFEGAGMLVLWMFIFMGAVGQLWKHGQKNYTGVGI